MHTRTEGNEHLLAIKEKENKKIIDKLEKKISSRDNLIKVNKNVPRDIIIILLGAWRGTKKI